MTETAEAPPPTGPTHPRLAGARGTTTAITVGLCAIIAGLCIALVTSLPAVHTADVLGVRALGHARSPALTSLIIPTLHIPFTVAWAVPLSAILGSVAAWRSRSWRPFAFLALSVAVSAAISHLAKAVVVRPRPTSPTTSSTKPLSASPRATPPAPPRSCSASPCSSPAPRTPATGQASGEAPAAHEQSRWRCGSWRSPARSSSAPRASTSGSTGRRTCSPGGSSVRER